MSVPKFREVDGGFAVADFPCIISLRKEDYDLLVLLAEHLGTTFAETLNAIASVSVLAEGIRLRETDYHVEPFLTQHGIIIRTAT